MNKRKLNAEEFAKKVDQEFNIDVTGYTDYKDRNHDIISNVIAGAPFVASLMPMTGVKANTIVELNIFSTDVTWSNADCVTGETGDNSVVEPRLVSAKRLTDRETLCLDKLDAKLPMFQAAGANNQELTWSDLFIQKKVEKNAYWLEKLAFQGDTTIVGATNNLNKANGWLKIADGETAVLGYYNTFSSFTVTNAIDVIDEAVMNRSETLRAMPIDELVILMDNMSFDILARAYTAAYGLNSTGVFLNTGAENQAGVRMMKDPNSGIMIQATHGLDGNGSIWLTNRSNMRYVTDLESDKDTVDLFFDKYHRALVSDIIFTIGFQYEFPENVVYLKYVAS